MKQKKKIIETREVNESIIVIYNTLFSLYKYYKCELPEKYSNMFLNVIQEMENDVHQIQQEKHLDYDIIKEQLIEKITFKKS